MGGQEHFYMETQSMLAVPKGEDQEIDLYVSTQFPTYIQVTPLLCGDTEADLCEKMCRVTRDKGLLP